MSKQFIFLIVFYSSFNLGFAQDLSVPDTILKELNTSIFIEGSDTLCFKYVYPENYDSTKTYPVLLGLSGGDQTEFIVDYCYAAWFRSDYFKHYFTILPVNILDQNILTYDNDAIGVTYDVIMSNFNVDTSNWIIVGTSNGGVASYIFVAKSPELFHGIITVPGSASDTLIFDLKWSHLHILNAVGYNDSEGWKNAADYLHDSIGSFSKSNELMVLNDVGHILPLSFNIDTVYSQYFSKTLGLDGNIKLNNAEIDYLNGLTTIDNKQLTFDSLKVAFISGSGGNHIISKEEYFQDLRISSYIIQLNEREKIKSGGYDVLITKWVKSQPKKYRKRIINTLSKLP